MTTARPRVLVVTGLVAAALVACSPPADPSSSAPAALPTALSSFEPSPSEPQSAHGRSVVLPQDVPVRPADDASTPPPPAPARLVVADLDVDMVVIGVGTEADGTMALPASGTEAGWYRFGSAPTSPSGTTVLASHVDTRAEGLGPFARLREAQVGAAVTVTDEDGTVHSYTVSAVDRIAKTDVPLDEVFDRSGPPRLVLLTCGGAWDESIGHYEDNVIVTAVPDA